MCERCLFLDQEFQSGKGKEEYLLPLVVMVLPRLLKITAIILQTLAAMFITSTAVVLAVSRGAIARTILAYCNWRK